METAGVEDTPKDKKLVIARKGLGTSATRAAIIEKIVKTGFVERQKKYFLPTKKGIALVEVLPDDIKSPLLTANFEQKLRLVELGELSAADFMESIESHTKSLVSAHKEPLPGMAQLFDSIGKVRFGGANGGEKSATSRKAKAANGKSVGKCPRCGSDVTESTKGYFCTHQDCKFVLWKNARFWNAKGKTLTTKTAAALLNQGRVSFSDLKSVRTGKTYAATIIIADDGVKTDFKLEFDKRNCSK
jgi:DNA topoisomerase-3